MRVATSGLSIVRVAEELGLHETVLRRRPRLIWLLRTRGLRKNFSGQRWSVTS